MNSSYHLNQAIFEWQKHNNTTALPKTLVATADVINDLQRQGAIPERMLIVYSNAPGSVLNVE